MGPMCIRRPHGAFFLERKDLLMMKRILTFLLSAMLLCLFAVPGAAEGNFYWDAADKLCGRMFVLALDPQYLDYMLGKDVTETSALASMQALAGSRLRHHSLSRSPCLAAYRACATDV